MTPEKLTINFVKLVSEIARKPLNYNSEYIASISESFQIYTRTRNINFVLSFNEILSYFHWPFPAFLLENEHSKNQFIKLSILFTGLFLIKEKFNDVLIKLKIKRDSPFTEKKMENFLNIFIPMLFFFFRRKVFLSWKRNPILSGKDYIIAEIKKTYKTKCWYACMVSSLPLLDLICRNFFNTNRLDRDITHLIGIFRKAGILSEDVKPGFAAQERAEKKGENTQEALKKI